MATRNLDEFLEEKDTAQNNVQDQNTESGGQGSQGDNVDAGASSGSDQAGADAQNTERNNPDLANNDLTNNENDDAGLQSDGDNSQPGDTDQPGFSIQDINRALGAEFESIDQIKDRLSLSSEVETLRAREQQHIEVLENVTNPRSLFASDKEYIRNEIKKNDKGLSSFVVDELLKVENVDEMDAEQALVLDHIMKTPAHQRDLPRVRKLIRKQYGLDKNIEGIDDDDEREQAQDELELNKMALEASAQEAKNKFKTILDVKIPEKSSIDEIIEARHKEREAQLSDRKAKFDPVIKEMANSFNDVKLDYPDGTVAMNFSVSEDIKPNLLEAMRKTALSLNLDPANMEDVKKLGGYARNYIIASNLSKILKAHEENIVAKMKDEEYRKHNVAGDQNLDQGRSDSTHAETNADIVRREAKRRD